MTSFLYSTSLIILNVLDCFTMKFPEYVYPLYKKSDKEAYNILRKLSARENIRKVKVIGGKEDVAAFIKLLLASQKMRDYRKFRDEVLKDLRNGTLGLRRLVAFGKKLKIPRGVDRSWAVFIQDKRLCIFIDELLKKNITFSYTNKSLVEFVVRFLLSQLLYDWRGPLLAVLLECLERRKVSVARLGRLLKRWNCTRVLS